MINFLPNCDACCVCRDCPSQHSLLIWAPPAQVELPRFSADLVDFEDRFLNSRINNKRDRPFQEREAVVKRVIEEIEMTKRLETNKV